MAAMEIEPTTGRFRIRAKSVFLTYPRFRTTGDRIGRGDLSGLLERIERMGPELPVGGMLCVEDHADGTQHLHAVLSWDTAVVFNDANSFNLEGHHPNIAATKSIKRSMEYLKKDGCYVQRGQLAVQFGECWAKRA